MDFIRGNSALGVPGMHRRRRIIIADIRGIRSGVSMRGHVALRTLEPAGRQHERRANGGRYPGPVRDGRSERKVRQPGQQEEIYINVQRYNATAVRAAKRTGPQRGDP